MATSAGNAFRLNAERIVHTRVNQVMRAVALEALKRFIERSPVKTGRFRANWNTSVGAEDGSVNEGATLADVAAAMERGAVQISACDFMTGQVLFICNGLPYAMALEDGHSSKAPAGMVSVSIAEMRAYAEEIAAALGGRGG